MLAAGILHAPNLNLQVRGVNSYQPIIGLLASVLVDVPKKLHEAVDGLWGEEPCALLNRLRAENYIKNKGGKGLGFRGLGF